MASLDDETIQQNEEALLLAMAPLDDVFAAFVESCQSRGKCRDSLAGPSWMTLEAQDRYAQLVQSNWTEFGPGDRYMRRIIRYYMIRMDEQGIAAESEDLLALVLRASLKGDPVPDPMEACYLSFRVPRLASETRRDEPLLRIRIYPHHNDVALRLWEAGACLAEFFLQYPKYVAGKRVIELGAGVGLTGLIIAGRCAASDVYLTDYTPICRSNLEHNIQINRSWLDSEMRQPQISQVRCLVR